MSDGDKMVAAIYAAAIIRSGPPQGVQLNQFLLHYDACIQELEGRSVAAREAESERAVEAVETWTKLGE